MGFRAFSNSKHTVTKPEDIKGLKVRTNQNPMYIEAFYIIRLVNPVPMPLSELYTALETRAVDAQEHPIGIFWSSKLYVKYKKYLSLSNHGYTPLIVVMNKAKLMRFPELQKAMVEAPQEAGVNLNVI